MKRSLSHIMWGNVDDKPFLKLAADLGFTGIEIAPSLIDPDVEAISMDHVQTLNKRYKSHGLSVVSFHSLFFQLPHFQVLGSEDQRKNSSDYFLMLGRMAHEFECPIMVFGSPKNRSRGNLDSKEAKDRAVSFFRSISPKLHALGVTVCIEPLATHEADFINDHKEGLELVSAIDHPAFQLMLDAKSLQVEANQASPSAEQAIQAAIKESLPCLKHFHVNDPQNRLPMSTGEVNHYEMGKALKESGYSGIVSLEVGRSEGAPEENIRQANQVLEKYYS